MAGRRRAARRQQLLVVGAGLLAAGTVAVLALRSGSTLFVTAAMTPWREHLSEALSITGLVIAFVGVIPAARLRRAHRRSPSVGSFGYDQRQRARRCVRRGQPASHEDQDAARVVAQVMVRQAVSALVTVGMALNLTGLTLRTASPWWASALAVVALAALVGQVVSTESARRARRWLRAFAPSPQDASQQPG